MPGPVAIAIQKGGIKMGNVWTIFTNENNNSRPLSIVPYIELTLGTHMTG